MGFSSLFKHGIEKHLWGVKNSIEIVLDFESKTATLVANSIQV
jgi:hypothetical protein